MNPMRQPTTPLKTSKKSRSPENLLRTKLSKLSNSLSDDELSEKEITQLKALSDLVTLRMKHRPWWRRRNVYWVFALLLLYGLSAWILLRRHESVTVQLEAIVSGLTFGVNNVDNTAVLTSSGMPLSDLTFNEAEVKLPRAFSTLSVEDQKIAKQGLALETNNGEGKIILDDINLLTGNEVMLRADASSFRLSVSPGSAQKLEPIRANVTGRILTFDQTIEADPFSSAINVTPTEFTSVDFTPATDSYELLDFKIPLESLGFREIKTGREQPSIDLISTLNEGSLYIESLDKTYSLRSGQNLTFNIVRDAFITSLRLEENGSLRLQFRGTVSDLETGYPDNPINLMPTAWAWLESRELAILALTTFWTLFTTFALPLFRT